MTSEAEKRRKVVERIPMVCALVLLITHSIKQIEVVFAASTMLAGMCHKSLLKKHFWESNQSLFPSANFNAPKVTMAMMAKNSILIKCKS